jgi:hypothetical protein
LISDIKGSELKELRVFENRALRRILGPKRDEVTVGWKNLYSLPNINGTIKSRNMILAGYLAGMEKMDPYKILVERINLNSTLQVCTYLTGNTFRLRYEPNRLMLFISL